MKPVLQRLSVEPEEGLAFKTISSSGFDCPYHVHPEPELILVLEGSGYRVVGDNLTRLIPGDLVLVGSWLPHMWREHSSSGLVKAAIVRFGSQFPGEGLLKLPAMAAVRNLFHLASRGLHIVGATRKKVCLVIKQMERSNELSRVAQALQILALLANSQDCHPIASMNFGANVGPYSQERMHRVFEFLTRRMGQEVRLSEVAKLVNLSEGAFSRYFRAHTTKTFPAFVNELRIGHACRLLTETEKKITEIAFDCGFRNLSNFNRQFLELKGVSPRTFRKQMPQGSFEVRSEKYQSLVD